MTTSTACPNAASLADYGRNELAAEDTATLDQHLADCPACLSQYLELGNRSLVPEVPHCRVVKEIGRGRFGVVYKAWWLADKPRIVALKVLSRGGRMEQSRFDREIAALKKIDSPWIVKCLDSGTAGEAAYFIMDYVEGVHLDEHLASSTYNLNAKLAVLQRVCRAVAHAHAAGVVHRDLKPSNILIDVRGHPHVVDFGICAVDSVDWSTWERLTITHPGDIVGTLKYMSPEQAWGRQVGSPVDKPSDIWALGILLHEIVTDGGYPYSLRSTPDKPPHEALLERIRKELPRIPRLDGLERGRDLEVLLERCLAWEPERRVQSAASLADDLERYRAGQRTKTRPLGILYRLRRLTVAGATRARWMFLAAFVALVGTVLWFAVAPLRVGWYVTGYQFPGQRTSSGSVANPLDARDNLLIVGVYDDTAAAVTDFASREGIEGVSASLLTWRAVHGCLMERLAAARPRAVVWDYYFRTPQDGDARLVAGLNRLEEAGVPVTLAALTYRKDGTPDLSPRITGPLAGRLRHGAIVARDMVRRPGAFVMAVKRPGHFVAPGLALTTLAALLHPDARLDLDWQQRDQRLDLLYEVEPGAYLRQRDRLECTRTFTQEEPHPTVRPGDLLACNTISLARPERWERQTVGYQELLTCSPERLSQLTADKVIIVGDLRQPRPNLNGDRHRVRYGGTIIDDVPGCYLLADAVASLLERRYLQAAFPLPATTFLPMLLVALMGCYLPTRLAANRTFLQPARRRLLWVVLGGLAAASLSVMALTRNHAAVHVGMAGFALLVPMAGSFWVEFARNRHRVLDQQRLAVEDLQSASDGTITLASPQQRWRSTAG